SAPITRSSSASRRLSISAVTPWKSWADGESNPCHLGSEVETPDGIAMTDLSMISWMILCGAVLTVAFFYSSVGHGGATGYLAALAVLGVAPASAKVAVLIANILVASVAWWRFSKAGYFNGRVLFTFAISSVPCAWLGSRIPISLQTYQLVLGLVLSLGGVILLLRARWQAEDLVVRKIYWPLALLVGAVLGFLAGLTGIGGGVFLSPVLYLFRWVKPKTTGGIAAGFIVVNSLAGLAGAGWERIMHVGPLLWLTLPAVIGALLGTHFGARRWSSVTFSRVLACVLIFAGGRLLQEAVKKNTSRDAPDVPTPGQSNRSPTA
ncbi:MAG: sulfite exporter TauE/SafE family protein, partial [Verrucomicrobia bacterium]|nr:sulfite exporter TauE/SafE family protein [Verrucomicrobiota bacterium]